MRVVDSKPASAAACDCLYKGQQAYICIIVSACYLEPMAQICLNLLDIFAGCMLPSVCVAFICTGSGRAAPSARPSVPYGLMDNQ